MPRAARVRRIAKWTGLVLVLCVGMVVVWVMSIGCLIRYDSQNVEFLIYSGCVQFTMPNPLPNRGWTFHRKPFNELLLWGEVFKITVGNRVFRSARIPVWIPFGLIAIPTAYLLYRDRRPPPGQCKRCRYDLTGNESGVCPECGEAA